MLYPTELRGRAVVVTAGGFCQTDTPVARTARCFISNWLYGPFAATVLRIP